MYQAYLFPIAYAFIAFPFVAALFTLPFLIVQYRKYGYIHKVRAITLYLLLLYLMNAFFLVILPLPSSRHNPALANGDLQLLPLQFVYDFLKETSVSFKHPSTYWHMFVERAFLQVIFNIFLTIPFGMFLRYYFRVRWGSGLILSFLLSLFFETTQLTGIYGIYDHAYRIFDIDDLLCNTLGGMLGFMIAEWIAKRLPRIEHLDLHIDRSSKRVSYTRRAVAFMIDLFFWYTLMILLTLNDIPIPFWISSGIYYILIPYWTNGITVGKWIVRIYVSSTNPDHPSISLKSLTIRYGLLYWVFLGLNNILSDTIVLPDIHTFWRALCSLLLFVIDISFFMHVMSCFFRKGSLLFYEKLSHTKHRIQWPELEPSALETKQGSSIS